MDNQPSPRGSSTYIMYQSLRVSQSEHRHRYEEAGVVRSFDPGSVTRGTACLTSVCVQGDLKAVSYGQAGKVIETTFFG